MSTIRTNALDVDAKIAALASSVATYLATAAAINATALSTTKHEDHLTSRAVEYVGHAVRSQTQLALALGLPVQGNGYTVALNHPT
jgi:hypothetical protein